MEANGAVASVTGLLSSVVHLATTLSNLKERYSYAALNITLITSSLFTIKAALEAIEDWRKVETSRSSQVYPDLEVCLQSCALLVAVIERKLAETNLIRPNYWDKVRFVSLDAIYKDFTSSLDGQIRALHLLLTIFQYRSSTEQRAKLEDLQTRSVFQQVLDSTASLRLEEKDLQDAASILSEDPSVILDVDAILLSTPLYQKVYKKRHPNYSYLPVIARHITRKEVGHIRGSSTGSSARSSKERPVDPYYAENLGLPFLGIPFHGEAPMPSLEEDFEVEEREDNADINKRGVEEKILPNPYLNHLSTASTAPNENDRTVDGSAKLSNDNAEVSRSSEAIQPVDNKTEAVLLDPGPITINQQAVQKQHRPLSQESDTIPRKAAELSPFVHFSFGSNTSSQSKLPPVAINDEVSLQTGSVDSNIISIQNNRDEVFVPALSIVKDLPLIPSVPIESVPLSVKKSHPGTTAQEGNREGTPSAGNKDIGSVNPSSEQYIYVESFDINFGPGPTLDIPDLQSTMKYDEGVLDYERLKSGNHNVKVEKTDGNSILSMTSQGSVSESLYVLKGAPPTQRVPPVPTISPNRVPNAREAVNLLVDSNKIDNDEVIRRSVDGNTKSEKVGTWSNGNDSISPLRSQMLDTRASTADLTAEAEATLLGNLPETSLQHDTQAGSQQIRVDNHNIKSRGNIQSARDVVSRSIALIQRKYHPDTTGHTLSTRRLPKLSSMSRLSVSSVFKHSEKISAVNAAATIGNSQQLIALLEENAKLAGTHTVQLSSGGIFEQRTPLMCAAIDGHVYCMEVLRRYGADLTMTDKKGKTALHLAVEAGQVDSVNSLVKLAADAGTTGQSACLTKLLEAADTDGSKPLHIAATIGTFDILNTLVAAGADLDAKNNLARTPLHCAVIERQDKIGTSLISRGAAVDALDFNRETPLMLAVKWNVLAISYLLQGGADKTLSDTNGDTVIHHAARLGHLGAIELLYTRLEDLEVRNRLGERPLHLAASVNNKNVVIDLLKRGVDVNPWSAPPKSKAGSLNFVSRTTREGIRGSHLSLSGTPLHYACYNGCYESSEALLAHGAWINAALENAQTSLMLAVQAQNLQLVSLLLTKGAKVNAANSKDCLTALHYACATGDLEITKLLVSHGANTRALNASSVPEDPAAYGARVQRKHMLTAQLEAARYVVELNTDHSRRSLGPPLETLSLAIEDISRSTENSRATQYG